MRGDLWPAEEVEMVWRAENSAVRAMLLAWSTTLTDSLHHAGRVDGAAGIERVIGAAVHEVLGELSDSDRPVECPHCGADLAGTPEPRSSKTRCQAMTERGKRCGNPARDDGYCFLASHKGEGKWTGERQVLPGYAELEQTITSLKRDIEELKQTKPRATPGGESPLV